MALVHWVKRAKIRETECYFRMQARCCITLPQMRVCSFKIWHPILVWFLQRGLEWAGAPVALVVRLRLSPTWPPMSAKHCWHYLSTGIMYRSASPRGWMQENSPPHQPFPPQHPSPLRSSRDAAVGHRAGESGAKQREWERTVTKKGKFIMKCRKPGYFYFSHQNSFFFPHSMELLRYPRGTLSFFHSTCPCS